MNISKIKEIVTNPLLDDHAKRTLIITIIADDVTAIPDVLGILDRERTKRKELISDMNVLLSKADAALDSPKLNKNKFIQKEVKDLYIKWKGFINHLWKSYKE